MVEISRKAQDPSLHFKVNIGLPFLKPSRGEEYQQRMQLLKEKRAATTKDNEIPIDQIRQDWFKTCGPHHLKNLAEHFNIYEDLFGEAYFLPRVPLKISYPQLDDSVMPVYFGNQIKPYEVNTK